MITYLLSEELLGVNLKKRTQYMQRPSKYRKYILSEELKKTTIHMYFITNFSNIIKLCFYFKYIFSLKMGKRYFKI